MKFISWNVNGLRSCINKGFFKFFNEVKADIFCIQETKMHQNQFKLIIDGYNQYWNDAFKKGYSGTVIFTRIKPISVCYKFNFSKYDNEGRMITLEFDKFFLINVYTPNSQRKLSRLEYRLQWEDFFCIYLNKLNVIKPLIICGDLNVAHSEIDIKNFKTNRRNAGFTDEERNKFTILLKNGFVDTFRYLYPDIRNAYTWWSYMMNSRVLNIGWRIDYFLISNSLCSLIKESKIYSEILGSDHCPIGLEIF